MKRTLDVVAITLHLCAASFTPQGDLDLFPSVCCILWLCTHRMSTPAYSIVCRNAAGIDRFGIYLLLRGL